MQTEQHLCWSGMTDTEYSKTSGSNEKEQENSRTFTNIRIKHSETPIHSLAFETNKIKFSTFRINL